MTKKAVGLLFTIFLLSLTHVAKAEPSGYVSTLLYSAQNKHSTKDVVSFSGGNFQISGEKLSMPNITSFSFVNAISCKDTIVFIVGENQLTKVLDVDSLLKPQGEEQLMLDAKDALAYKTIDNMEENTDGDYDVPYLFLMDPKDTLQYITTFPIQKPYTYELCTARFAWDSQLEMCRLVKDNVVFIDSESLVLEMHDKETSRYRYLCNTWALDQFQSEWTQRSNTRAGCWHYLATRIIFIDKKVHCIDFEYIK